MKRTISRRSDICCESISQPALPLDFGLVSKIWQLTEYESLQFHHISSNEELELLRLVFKKE